MADVVNGTEGRYFDAFPSVMCIDRGRFPKMEFPAKYVAGTQKYEYQENEVRKFYKNPQNVRRTIFVQNVPNDVTDARNIFGSGPVFIFIESVKPDVSDNPDVSSNKFIPVSINSEIGLVAIPDLESFPSNLDIVKIPEFDCPDLYNLIKKIMQKKIRNSKISNRN